MLFINIVLALLLFTIKLMQLNCDIIVKDQGIELTNLYNYKPKNNYYQVLNGLNNHIIKKSYSSFKSPAIENIQYSTQMNNDNENLFTELQSLIIQQYLIDKNNNVNQILFSNELSNTLSTATVSLSTSNALDANDGGESMGEYIIMEDINSFATGGRLSVGESTQLKPNNLDINALYQQSLNNKDGTIGFTLSNSPNGKEAANPNVNPNDNNKPQTNTPAQPTINSIPTSSTQTTKRSSGNYIISSFIRLFFLLIIILN